MHDKINKPSGVSYWRQNRLSEMKASFDFPLQQEGEHRAVHHIQGEHYQRKVLKV